MRALDVEKLNNLPFSANEEPDSKTKAITASLLDLGEMPR